MNPVEANPYKLLVKDIAERLLQAREDCNNAGVEWCRLDEVLELIALHTDFVFSCPGCDYTQSDPLLEVCPKCGYREDPDF